MPSGETEEDKKAHVMQLYREKNATVDNNGIRKLKAPEKYIAAVVLQSFHPKLSAAICNGSDSTSGYL